MTGQGGALEILTYGAAVERIRSSMRSRAETSAKPVQILEAGCGRRWEIDLDSVDFQLTGVDLDPHALDYRRTVTGDLDVGVVGSVCDRTVVPADQFDVIYSAYVLEHVDGAQRALENFTHWVRPGGLIVMMLPNRDSVYGWVARHTPFSIHVWVYRYLFRERNAGKPGFSPYPTHHDPVLAPDELSDFCAARGFSLQECFAIDSFSERHGARFSAVRAGMRIVSRLSFGRLSDREVDLGIVIRAPLTKTSEPR